MTFCNILEIPLIPGRPPGLGGGRGRDTPGHIPLGYLLGCIYRPALGRPSRLLGTPPRRRLSAGVYTAACGEGVLSPLQAARALGSKAQKALGRGPGESNSIWFVARPPIRQDYVETTKPETRQDWIGPKGISKHRPLKGLCFLNPVLKESLI